MPTREEDTELIEFAPNVYGLRAVNHVPVFFVTPEGVIVVDPCGMEWPEVPSLLKEAIESKTDAPVRYVIYSHWGPDHGMGGSIFADTAQFVGHRNANGRMMDGDLKDPHSPVPGIVVEDRPLPLELGGRKLNLIPADIGQNDDYLFIHAPDARVVMFVDVVQPRSLPYGKLLGHPDRIIERLQWLHDELDFDVLISGHATPKAVCTKEDVLETRQYYIDLADAVEASQKAGHVEASPEMVDAVRESMVPRYGEWRRFDQFLASNVEGVIGWRAGKNLRTT